MMLNSNMDQAQFLSQRNKFLEIVEELRHYRVINETLEEKIAVLHGEKIGLGDAADKYQSMLKKSEERCVDLEQQLTQLGGLNRDSNVLEENSKLKVALSAAESSIKELKSKIVGFSAIRTDLEKKLEKSEKKLVVSMQSCDSFLDRTTQFQSTAQKLTQQLQQTSAVQSTLERNIEASGNIIRNLILVKEHQKCIIEDLKKEKKNLVFEVAELNSRLALKEESNGNHSKEYEQFNIQLESAVGKTKMLQLENQTLEKQLEMVKTSLSESAIAMSKTNQLLERNEQLGNKTISDLQQKLETYIAELDDLRVKSNRTKTENAAVQVNLTENKTSEDNGSNTDKAPEKSLAQQDDGNDLPNSIPQLEPDTKMTAGFNLPEKLPDNER